VSELGTLPFQVVDATIAGGQITVSPAGLPVYTGFVNIYAEVLVPYNTETTVVSYTVPAGHTVYVNGLRGSGDTCGEFYVKIDGSTIGYGRTTASTPTCASDYLQAPKAAMAGQTITITCITYENAATHTMRASLLGGYV